MAYEQFRREGDGNKKITVTLPEVILNRLDEKIPPRKRSLFIAEAIKNQLALLEQTEALEDTAGAWSEERYPNLADGPAIDRWIREMRAGWQRRSEE